MANTSATGGYLIPSSPEPATDDGLDDLLQEMIVGITELSAPLVRPRWQPNPPKQPAVTVDWAAVGVTNVETDTYGHIQHNPAGEGADTLLRFQTITVMASFYGPNRRGYAQKLADGLLIPQNREQLVRAGLNLVTASGITSAADLFNVNWIPRADILLMFGRQITRTYPVLNLISAHGSIYSGPTPQDFDTEN